MSDTLSPEPTPGPERDAAVPAQPAEWQPPAHQPPAAPGGPSPRVRIALRWTVLALVFAVFGAGTAYAVTRPDRTDIPGLKTPDDGRWTFPRLAMPGLPPHMPRPLDSKHNPGGVHYADLRTLLLPVPEKGVNDPAFPGVKHWLDPAVYVKVLSTEASQHKIDLARLKDDGLRHIAARAWTMPDGTRAEVYLVQYVSTAYAQPAEQQVDAKPLVGVKNDRREKSLAPLVPHGIRVTAYSETAPYGASMSRFALLVAGDTLAVVRLTREDGTVPMQAFKQTVALQAQLLG